MASKYRQGILVLLTAIAVIGIFFLDRIPQDTAYHHFADTRKIVDIPNFWNVFSNIPFLLAGLYGLRRSRHLPETRIKNGYQTLCISILLVSFGSAYYHYTPSTPTLIWDRLPITVAFMALTSLLLDERVIHSVRSLTLWPLAAIGIAAAIYWYWTESLGVGDLRPYVLVQFLPLVLIPTILLLFARQYLNDTFLVYALLFYAAAKVCEHFDWQILAFSNLMSGHAFKHLLAGFAAFCIILSVPINKAK